MSLDINITYILVLALFLVPVLLLNALVFKPFLKLLEQRHEQLEGVVQRADKMLAEAEERAKTFEEKIQVATQRGIEARNTLRAEATQEMNALLEAERKRMTTKVEEAFAELGKKREVALSEVTAEAEKIASVTVSKLLGRSVV